ncbi:MAG: SH3 domain-containing protein [Candidatus Omnitrophica bacterium]|nr:SH3 domain-containing protein [Candidatus Omnitrophota bacterium]
MKKLHLQVKRKHLRRNNLPDIVLRFYPRRMNFRINSLVLFFILVSSNVIAQQNFPFLAKIKEKSVHIRAGQNKSFESLGRVNQDEQVVVVDKSYSWYKIRLPQQANSFISSEFVKIINGEVGEITTNRVNIRAGAGVNFTVLGQLNKGDQVIILEQPKGWYKIQPIKDSYGWIAEDLVEFLSSDVSSYEAKEIKKKPLDAAPVQVVPVKTVKPVTPATAAAEQVTRTAPRTVPQTSFQGTLTANKGMRINDYPYLLTDDQQKIYYLDGLSQLLQPFVNYKVKIEGRLKNVKPGASQYPVIVVNRIQLIL